ncbi:hypothetical protein VNO77_19174 [Canavalia gladiata]|uniref:Uncharacterized protein n=1 Tax=Canavalia gladiata TaxID=3824 RepID=A0AAN9LLY9_CANGL
MLMRMPKTSACMHACALGHEVMGQAGPGHKLLDVRPNICRAAKELPHVIPTNVWQMTCPLDALQQPRIHPNDHTLMATTSEVRICAPSYVPEDHISHAFGISINRDCHDPHKGRI